MARVPKRLSTSTSTSTSSNNNNHNDIAPPFRPSSSPHTDLKRRAQARSCRGCHQRKVRCDRGVPCTNCSRCGISCVYPIKDKDKDRDREARKSPTLQNISNRLERLEVLLSRFVESGFVTAGAGSAADRGGGCESQVRVQVQSGANVSAAGPATANQHSCKSTWELLLNDGQVVRYVNNANIEILLPDEDGIKIIQPASLETAPSHLPKSTNHHTLLAQPGACAPPADIVSDVLEFYPDPQLALQLWTVYVKSVDPVLKILHIPTVQSTVVATILDPRSAPSSSSTVALTFAIYFAAVTALCHCHDESSSNIDLPWDKRVLLKRYKMALDRLLLVTDLMNQPDMTALQALTIYVTCLRVHEVGRSVWILNGLAIRLAQSIGLHRDGACLQLTPFETEMRLRLWWHLCVLDSRAPEDQGLHPTVDVLNRGLRLPLNVNDNQICPDMTRLPVEVDGWTEMSFFLIQTESCRLLHPILDKQHSTTDDALLDDITAKRKLMQEHGQYLSAKYGILFGSSGTTPTDLSRIAIQHITTACKKMEFVLQLREEISMEKQKGAARDDTTPAVLKPSFRLACDGLESTYVLLKEGLASRFKWFFTMYTPWYALAYVLRCLCSSSSSPCGGFESERAWVLVEELFPRGMSFHGHDDHHEYGHSSIWRCLNRLRCQILSLRQQQHAQLAVATTADVEGYEHCTSSSSHLLPDTARTSSTLPELDQEEFIAAANSNQSIFSSLDLDLDLSMPEIPFLPPDWNAVINGCLDDDGGQLGVL